MKEIIIDTLKDSLLVVPFLFIAFLIIELIEHKFSKKTNKIISSSGKLGPFFGGLLGLLPQCGFSVLATNLYVTRIISLGTLISVYLATSDEMLPILISSNVDAKIIIKVLVIKFIIGCFIGFIIDLIYRRKNSNNNYDICDSEHCDCEHSGIIKSSLIHTLKTILFIIIISFIINIVFHYFGEDYLSKLLLKDSFFGPFITSLIGLIPNCGASVALTELFINNAITFGSLVGGLLTGSGISLLVLFKSNKNIKENLSILAIMYIVGVIFGIIIDLI